MLLNLYLTRLVTTCRQSDQPKRHAHILCIRLCTDWTREEGQSCQDGAKFQERLCIKSLQSSSPEKLIFFLLTQTQAGGELLDSAGPPSVRSCFCNIFSKPYPMPRVSCPLAEPGQVWRRASPMHRPTLRRQPRNWGSASPSAPLRDPETLKTWKSQLVDIRASTPKRKGIPLMSKRTKLQRARGQQTRRVGKGAARVMFLMRAWMCRPLG